VFSARSVTLAGPFRGASNRRSTRDPPDSQVAESRGNGGWVITPTEAGTPQGAVASPLLANVYLHYVFICGRSGGVSTTLTAPSSSCATPTISSWAVVGFEYEADAQRFHADLQQRMEKFALSLHPGKTRVIEFGRFAAVNRAQRGLGKPETFAFLGFVHICGHCRRGFFQLKRKSRRDRMRAKLRAIKEELWRRRHEPIPQQGRWLHQVVRGYFAYHAVPTNVASLSAFGTMSWISGDVRLSAAAKKTTLRGIASLDLRADFSARTAHPSSVARRLFLPLLTPRWGARCVNCARRGSVRGGCAVMRIPYRDRWKCRAGAATDSARTTQSDSQDGRREPAMGEERIANELLVKLGIQVSPRTVRKSCRNDLSLPKPVAFDMVDFVLPGNARWDCRLVRRQSEEYRSCRQWSTRF